MTDESISEDGGAQLPAWTPPDIDRNKAHPARIYDYLLGGKDNFDVDREAAEVALKLMPELRGMARVNRAFLGRAVRHLAEAGITQFLDIGTGIPGPGNTGEIARGIHPGARVVYVDYDPIVSAHSRALLAGADPELTAIVQADVREPKTILDNGTVHAVLDFDKPVAVLMVAVLHFVSDAEDAHGIAAQFVDVLAPGGALAVSHASEGHVPGKFGAARKGWNNATSQLVLRDREEIAGFFTGTELLEPGVTIIPAWRPDAELTDEERSLDYGHAAVGIKR
ncbi:SAM-dependent methyltransferase [Catenulispora rubra]|uniref:SAM-dependent methyltransferase n=1 Tax=Catenulispora rubra TaxID=280293 RepID=UPI001891FB63|nr:SAM-dependent methyltransferase [Catenulispora rubra]